MLYVVQHVAQHFLLNACLLQLEIPFQLMVLIVQLFYLLLVLLLDLLQPLLPLLLLAPPQFLQLFGVNFVLQLYFIFHAVDQLVLEFDSVGEFL